MYILKPDLAHRKVVPLSHSWCLPAFRAPNQPATARLQDPPGQGPFLGPDRAQGDREEAIDDHPQPDEGIRMMAITGQRTVPQIFIGSTHVGGHDDLVALDRRGGLMPLLTGE